MIIEDATNHLMNLAPHVVQRKTAVIIKRLLEELEKQQAVIDETAQHSAAILRANLELKKETNELENALAKLTESK